MRNWKFLSVLLLCMAVVFSSCGTWNNTAKGTAIGVGGGAAVGADPSSLGLFHHLCMVYPFKNVRGAAFGADPSSSGLFHYLFMISTFKYL